MAYYHTRSAMAMVDVSLIYSGLMVKAERPLRAVRRVRRRHAAEPRLPPRPLLLRSGESSFITENVKQRVSRAYKR